MTDAIEFKESLYDFVLHLENYINHSLERYTKDLVVRGHNYKPGEIHDMRFLSDTKKEFLISSANEDQFFRETLEIIYQVRSTLVHW